MHGVQEPPCKASKGSQVGVHRMLGDSCGSLLSPDINLPPKRLLIFIANLSDPVPGPNVSTQHDLLHSVRGTHISTPSALVPEWHIAPGRVLACSKHNGNQESTHLLLFSPCPFPVSQNAAEGGGMKRRVTISDCIFSASLTVLCLNACQCLGDLS